VTLAMSAEERETFLADLHVGVLSVAGGDGRGPLSVPMWYRYEPGGVAEFVTGAGSRKLELIRRSGRCSLCAQSEELPYRYVSVEGPATVHGAPDDGIRRAIATRYLGPERAEAYLAATAAEAGGSAVVRLRPEHWLSADFGRR
jgi:PPOX class probable F420-dependent enzyme